MKISTPVVMYEFKNNAFDSIGNKHGNFKNVPIFTVDGNRNFVQFNKSDKQCFLAPIQNLFANTVTVTLFI